MFLYEIIDTDHISHFTCPFIDLSMSLSMLNKSFSTNLTGYIVQCENSMYKKVCASYELSGTL